MTTDRIVEKTFCKKAKIIIKDEVNCIVTGLHPDHQLYFYEEYGIYAENYFFTPKYKIGVWDGKLRYFNKEGHTYVLLLDEIVKKVVKFGYKVDIEDRRINSYCDVPAIDSTYLSNFIDPKTDEPYMVRPYQVDALNSIFAEGFGIIIAGTGAGKTTINTIIVDHYEKLHGLRSITIVPSVSLIDQTIDTFKTFGLDVGRYDDEIKDLKHSHVVTTWQALQHNPHIIKSFQVAIVDECHGLKGKVLTNLLNDYGKHITHRFGLTGTLPKGKTDAMAVRIAIGPVRYVIPAHELIEQGWLATPHISVMQLDDISRLEEIYKDDDKVSYDSEISFLQTDATRMSWIADYLVQKGSEHKGNVLCLVTNVSFGKKLKKLIPEAHFLYGKDKQKVRKAVYDLFESNNNLIVIATVQIAGVGLSIDRIFNLVFVDGGKSFIRIIQLIGRGLRKGKDKDSVDVTDVCSNLDYSKKHLRERVKYYIEAKYPHKKHLVSYL
jgi:superfamily II DNA or RNA helicase